MTVWKCASTKGGCTKYTYILGLLIVLFFTACGPLTVTRYPFDNGHESIELSSPLTGEHSLVMRHDPKKLREDTRVYATFFIERGKGEHRNLSKLAEFRKATKGYALEAPLAESDNAPRFTIGRSKESDWMVGVIWRVSF